MPDFAPGERIAKDIVLVRPLIQGGMGSIWAARHEGRKQEVAVKILLSNFADDEVAKERFAREAAAAIDAQNEHVVQMLDYGIAGNGRPYLVMELLNGEDLEAHLAAHPGPMPARDVVSIITQVGQALERAHELKIVHRDIKPANIFLVPSPSGERFNVKLLDFGFAKRVDRKSQLTEEGMIVGTPHYMSLEQMTGTKLDLRSDLFSLGAVAFEAFTGQRPFAGKTLRHIADAIQDRPHPRPSELNPKLPPELDAWFAKACARDRDDRFKSAREMIDALQRAFSSGPASSLEAAPDARRASSGSSGWKWLLFVLLLAGTAAAVWKLQLIP